MTFQVEQGEIFGFIGPNGAGKTTTIRTLLGFLRPTSGSARIFDLDVVSQGQEIKKRIGYLPADVNYYDDMRAGELLDLSARFHGVAASARIAELSQALGLDLGKRIRSLSTGNRKKVGIVQALLHEPDLLILDEPTSGLDPLVQHTFFELLRAEKEQGRTIFFSSHVLSEVQRLCDRVAIIRDGRIIDVERVDGLGVGQYKRVRVKLRNPGATLDLPGAHRPAGPGADVELIYRGGIDDLVKQLARHEVEDVWIEDPPLEEIFLHYYQGDAERSAADGDGVAR
ncbi:ABC transporter ATP-binding protein [Micromonospora sp. KC207]|uniref:ABC transporter ATP-binding protein n=1 Tax=Micromonospora sp. KC207 TaxID=2530377 RepID=UPI001A9F194C|nr:ABC transporter ATP-binding protein [Micromonospora sp. KC207]